MSLTVGLSNAILQSMKSFGEQIEIIRKKRGITRGDLATQLGVTEQTVFNIERSPSYNLGTRLFKRLEEALNLKIEVTIREVEMATATIRWGNDEGILHIRKHFPNCSLNTQTLGKMIWEWLRERQAQKCDPDQIPSLWDSNDPSVRPMGLPKTSTQFEFDIALMSDLYDYLGILGRK